MAKSTLETIQKLKNLKSTTKENISTPDQRRGRAPGQPREGRQPHPQIRRSCLTDCRHSLALSDESGRVQLAGVWPDPDLPAESTVRLHSAEEVPGTVVGAATATA